MKSEEVADLVQVILDSLRANPSQFNFTVSVKNVGAVGMGTNGGIGIVGISQGGGTGFRASASSPTQVEISIAQQQASERIRADAGAALRTIEAILQELRAQSLTAAKRDGFLAQLKGTWLPNVIIGLLTTMLGAVVAQ